MRAKAIILDTVQSRRAEENGLETRYNGLKRWLDQKISSAPGKNHFEKTDWLWKNDPQYAKVVKGLTTLSAHKSSRAKTARRGVERNPPQYFIRFGDLPDSGKSAIWYGASEPQGYEPGISAYPAKWNEEHQKWEIETGSGQYMMGLDHFMSNPKIRPAYLLYGKHTNDDGEDGEPLVTRKSVKVVKKLDPSEIVVPGYYD